MKKFLIKLWNAEPALIVGFLRAGMLVAVAFGLNITDTQQTAVLTFAIASLALSALTRSQVTPAAKSEQNVENARKESWLAEESEE